MGISKLVAVAAAGLLTLSACSGGEDVATGQSVSEEADGTMELSTAAGGVSGGVSTGLSAARAGQVPPVLEDRPPAEGATNGFIPTATDPLSTFGTDVDTASYTYARRLLNLDSLPERASIRPEEFVNAFDQGYRAPEDDGFRISVDGAPTPFTNGSDHRLVRIGLQTRPIAAAERRAAALTFVVDVSGSMGDDGKLSLVKRSLTLLLEALQPTDTVALVTYSEQAKKVLDHTPISQRARIIAALDALAPTNGTNVEAGVKLGYDVARAGFRPGAINRVVVASDGLANQGAQDPAAMVTKAGEGAAKGIQLVTAGFGVGYHDSLMEQLAQKGDGFAAYIDDEDEARRLLVERLNALLEPRAADAKVQVAFDAASVIRYRLVGYENRAVADDDFRKDDVDGGEIGAGHQVTALYEVQLRAPEKDKPLAEVTLRWLHPETRKASEAVAALRTGDIAEDFRAASPRFQLSAVVAAFAEVLRDSEHARDTKLGALADEATRIAGVLGEDGAVAELAKLIKKADALSPR